MTAHDAPGPAAPERSLLRAGAVIATAWLAIGLGATSIAYANLAFEGSPITLWQTMGIMMPVWVYWALATPLVIVMAKRWPPSGTGWPLRVAAHVGLASLLHLGASVVSAWSSWMFLPAEVRTRPFSDVFMGYAISRWPFHVLIYAAIAGAWLTLDSWRRLRERDLHASQLEAQLAKAQLSALQMQLHPHFLFNTLQAISVLTVENPRSAQHMLTLLGDLLRTVLEGGDQQEVPLGEELQFVRRYLEIEQVRFGDRLHVSIDVPAETLGVMVPGFVLQPLVENAIRHAFAARASVGDLHIGARLLGGNLELVVRDNGPGPGDLAEDGVGLSTTRARLAKLYGAAQQFTLRTHARGGAEAIITLPARAGA